jgi:membrane-bound ClpP family serine protease
MQLLFWALVLLFVGLGLIATEVFIPSGGVLGALAALAVLAAIGFGFAAGPLLGLMVLAMAIFGVPAMLMLAFRVWPSTPMGRRILLEAPSEEQVLPDDQRLRELKQLVGKTGVVRTVMLPSGQVEIAGQTIDAMSQGIAIEPGQRVRVAEVHGTRVFVLPIGDDAPASPTAAIDSAPQPPPEAERPLASFDLDDIDLGQDKG